MSEPAFYPIFTKTTNDVGPEAPLDTKVDYALGVAQKNRETFDALTPQMGESAAATSGAFKMAMDLDNGQRKAVTRLINNDTAFKMFDMAKQSQAAKEAPDLMGPFQSKEDSETESKDFKERQIADIAEKRGAELGLWNPDEETHDQKRARILAGQTQSPEEKELLLNRERQLKKLADAPSIVRVGSDGRPLLLNLQTSANVDYGSGQAFQVAGKTYVGIKMTRDENGQEYPPEKIKERETLFMEVDANWDKFHKEKEDQRASLTAEIEALEMQQKQQASHTANAFMGSGGMAPEVVLNQSNERLIENKKIELDKLNGEIEMLEGPTGRDEVIRMRAAQQIVTDPRFKDRLPQGEHIGFSKIKEGFTSAGDTGDGLHSFLSGSLNPGHLLAGSSHAINIVGGVSQTVLTQVQAAKYYMGASPKEMAKSAEMLQNFGPGMAAAGYGKLSHDDDMGSKILLNLPTELAETGLDIAFGYFTGLPAATGARMISQKVAKEFLKQSGKAVGEIATRTAARMEARALARFEAKYGSKVTSMLSAIPGALEEAGGVTERFIETEQMHSEADILDAQLQKDNEVTETVEGGAMKLAPGARQEMMKKRDALRSEANKKEEAIADAFYATTVASYGTQFVNLDKIVKTGPKGSNIADIFMRKMARNKLGANATEEAIEAEAKEITKTLTDDRIMQFMQKHGKISLGEVGADTIVGFVTETFESAMTTGIANEFFEENEDILGQGALTEGGTGAIVALMTSVATGLLSAGQKRRAMGDLLQKNRQVERLRGESTDKMLEELTNNGLKDFGRMQKPEEVVTADADGKFSIKDDADIGTIDAPRGFFAGLRFDTREEAETFAKDRWETAFDYAMDKALPESINVVDADGNIVANPTEEQVKAQVSAAKGMMRVVANNAAESGKTTTNHIFSALLKSNQIGGNRMLGNVDRSLLSKSEQTNQDYAVAVLALATSTDAVADPKIQAALLVAGKDASAYMEQVQKYQEMRKLIIEDVDKSTAEKQSELDSLFDQNAQSLMSGNPVEGLIDPEKAAKMRDDATLRGTLLKNAVTSGSDSLKKNAVDSLLTHMSPDDVKTLFDKDGKPVADFESRVSASYAERKAADALESDYLDAVEALKAENHQQKNNRLSYMALPRFTSEALAGNTEAQTIVQEAFDKIQANKQTLKNRKQAPVTKPATPPAASPAGTPAQAPASTPAPTQAPATAPAAPAFQEDPKMEASILEADAKGQNFTPAQDAYQRRKDAALNPPAPATAPQGQQLHQEGQLFQSDDPVEDVTPPSVEGDFDYSLARVETDVNGVERRVYNYAGLEKLLFDSVKNGKINGFPVPPAMRNPAGLAMVFLRAQAYAKLAAAKGQKVDQREGFRKALVDIYGDGVRQGTSRTGNYREYLNESTPIHKEVFIEGQSVFSQMRKNSNKGNVTIYTPDDGDNSLPLGFFGPVAFTDRVTNEKGETNKVTVYALVSDVYSFDDKKGYFDKGPWKGKPIKTSSVKDPDDGTIIKATALAANAPGQHSNKKVTAYKHPETGKWIIPGKNGAPPFEKKRGYKLTPVSKEYAEARAMFDHRAKQRATVEAYMNSPLPAGKVSLMDSRTQAKLRTREVLGMTIEEISDEEREAEVKKLEAELSQGLKRLESLGDTVEGLESIVATFSKEAVSIQESIIAAQKAMSDSLSGVQEASKEVERVAREIADASPTPAKGTAQPTPVDPAVAAANQAKITAARDAFAAAKEKHDEAVAAFALEEAKKVDLRANNMAARMAVVKLNWVNSRKQMISDLSSGKNLPSPTDTNFLETLSKSPSVSSTVRAYASAIMQDLKDAGITETGFRTEEVEVPGKGKKKPTTWTVVTETNGEYLARMAQMAVDGMAKMWMRSRTEELLNMEVETSGPQPEDADAVFELSFEDKAFGNMAQAIFPNFDPATHSRNIAIETILLDPDTKGGGHVTMPSWASAKDVIRKGEVGFARRLTAPGTNALDVGAIAKEAIADAKRRGKTIPPNGLSLIRLSDGTWLRFNDNTWKQVDKAFMHRFMVKAITGLEWSGTKQGKASAAAILDGVRTGKEVATDPASITDVVETYRNYKQLEKTPYTVAAARLILSMGPDATPAVAALHRSLMAFTRISGARARDTRGPIGVTLNKPVHRSGTQMAGLESLPFEEQLEQSQKWNDDIDGALGGTEKAVTDFMQGGRFLQATEGPQSTYSEVIGGVLTTFPGNPGDEMINAMLDSLGMATAQEQESLYDEAEMGDEEQKELLDDLDTINEADEQELEEGDRDAGILTDDSEDVEDKSIYSEESGMGIGNTDTQDYQRLVEMMKTRSFIPQDVQNLGEFTIEQWMAGQDFSLSKDTDEIVEDWGAPKQKEGFVIQLSGWGRRRLVPQFEHSGQLGMMNPESPIRKEAMIGDIVYVGNEAFEVVEDGEKFKLGPVKDMSKDIFAAYQALKKHKKEEKAKTAKEEESSENAEFYDDNPYPKPSVYEVDTIVNRMLGQSVQTATRLAEAQAIRSRLRRLLMSLRTETNADSIRAVMKDTEANLSALASVETVEKLQKLSRRLKKIESSDIPDSAKGRERLQKKLVGTFWYRSRVKPAMADLSRIIWDYKPKEKESVRPDLKETKTAILENLGIPPEYSAREILDDMMEMAEEGTQEEKQKVKNARIYIGAMIAWMDATVITEGSNERPFGDLVEQFNDEIGMADDAAQEFTGKIGPQFHYDYKYLTDMMHGYHQEMGVNDRRAMAAILTDVLLESTAAIDKMSSYKHAESSRARVSTLWQGSKFVPGTQDSQFGSIGDRIRAAMMPSGWTIPYTQEGIDMSNARDSAGPDYGGTMERPPYSPVTESEINWATSDRGEGLAGKGSRTKRRRVYFGKFENKKSKYKPSKAEVKSALIKSTFSKIDMETASEKEGRPIDVAKILKSTDVTGTILGVNPELSSMSEGRMEPAIIHIIESNRAARMAYYRAKSDVRNALSKFDQAVPQSDPATEALFNLMLKNWTPKNDKRGDKKKGEPDAGLQPNPEMTGAPETLYQGAPKGWKGRVTIDSTVPHAILELNPKTATAETFGHEVVHWLNNVRLSDGTSLLEVSMGKEGYANLMAWAEDGDPPSNYPMGSVERAKAWRRVEERLANGVMAYFSSGPGGFVGAEDEISRFAGIVQRVWRQVRNTWEADARTSLWGTPEGKKAIEALDDLFIHSTGAKQLRKIDRVDMDQEAVLKQIMKQFPKISRTEALQMLKMIPDVRKRMVSGLAKPIIPSTNEGLTADDPFTALYQMMFDHTPNVATAPAEPKALAGAYRKSRSSLTPSKLWQMAIKFMASFRARGMVTEEVFQAKLKARGFRAKLQQMSVAISDDLRVAIDHAVGYGDAKQKTLEIYKQMNSYLTAGTVNDRLIARQNLSKLGGPRLVIGVIQARSLIDKLSNELISEGYVHGDVALTIKENVGTYLHRKFPMAKDMDLTARYQNPKMSALVTAIAGEMIKRGFVASDSEARDLIEQVLGKIDSTSLNPQKFLDMIGQMQGLSSALKSRNVKDEDLAMLLAPLTGMETNPIIRISDTIRVLTDMMTKTKFQAELRDAGLQAGYIGLPGDKRFTKTFGETEGGAKGKPALDSNAAAEANPADANTLGPLQGYSGMPEVVDFYHDVVKTEFEFANAWTILSTMNRVNGLMKVMATVHNWPTGLKNIYGAFLTYVGQGRSIRGLHEAWGVVIEAELSNLGDRRIQRQARVDKARAMFAEFAELGLVDGGQLGEFLELAANGSKFATSLVGGVIAADTAENFFARKFRRGFEKYRRARTRFYLQGDLFFKIAAYSAELADLRQVYATDTSPSKPTDDQIKRMAANRTSMTMFSFDREPAAVRILKGIPFMGNFISFQAGMLRARLSGFKMVLDDFLEAKRMMATNRAGALKMGRMATRRAAGLVTVHAMATKMATSFVASLFGWAWDEEKLEALRNAAPDFQRGALLMPLEDFVPGGKIKYINLSTILPDAWHQRFAGSLMGLTWELIHRAASDTITPEFEQKMKDEMIETVMATTGPFVDATATRKAMGIIFNNEDQYNNRIREPHDGVIEKAVSTVMEIVRMYIPGDIKTAARLDLTPADWNRLILNGTPKQMEDWKKGMSALGLGVSTIDMEENLQYRFATETEAVFSSKAELTEFLTNKNVVLDHERADAQLRDHIYSTDQAVMRLSRTMESAFVLGTPPTIVVESLSKASPKQSQQSLNKEMKMAVIKGHFGGQVTLSKQAFINIIEAAKEAKDPQRMALMNRWIGAGVIKIESGR